MLIQEICVLSLPEMLCKLTYITVMFYFCRYGFAALLMIVWFGQYVFAGMVLLCSRRLAFPYSQTFPSNTLISYLFPLSMRFLEWLVASFSFSFVYILILSSSLVVCMMIVFKIGSIRWNANVRTYFRSYKTSYNLFSYI